MLLKRDTKQRVARTQAGGMFGGNFMLYRKADIYIDLDRKLAEKDIADGSEKYPINNFDTLFDDDELECTCQNICCDKIVVRVKGKLKGPVEGIERNYAGNLVIIPWEDKQELRMQKTIKIEDSKKVSIKQDLISNLHGVRFKSIDFVNTVKVEKDDDVELGDELNAVGEINIFRDCNNITVDNCTLEINGDYKIDTLPGVEESKPTEPGKGEGGDHYWTGAAAGGGGGGGGVMLLIPGWRQDTYRRPEDEGVAGTQSIFDDYIALTKTICTAACFHNCLTAKVLNSSLIVNLDIRSSSGSRAQGFGLVRSSMPRIEDSEILIQSVTYDVKGGLVIKEIKDEVVIKEEVKGFDLAAVSISCPLALCSTPAIKDSNFTGTANATSIPHNQPTSGKIGGISSAEAYNLLDSPSGEIINAAGYVGADAKHPTRWTFAIKGLKDSEADTIKNSNFPASYSQSSHTGAIAG